MIGLREKILSLENQVKHLTAECLQSNKQLLYVEMQLDECSKKLSENEEEKANLLDLHTLVWETLIIK
jgi:septal ring factor EnvC (AmiA/AmiB activator)